MPSPIFRGGKLVRVIGFVDTDPACPPAGQEHLGVHGPGVHGQTFDRGESGFVPRRQDLRQLLGEHGIPQLGAAVGSMRAPDGGVSGREEVRQARERARPADGGRGDDPGFVAARDQGEETSGQQEGGHHVDGPRGLEALSREGGVRVVDPGVVDEDVDPIRRPRDGLGQTLDLAEVRKVRV